MKWYKRDQHILIDKRVLNRIIRYTDLNKHDIVLEIGAGSGNLTQELAKYAGKVIAIEVDTKLASLLKQWRNVQVIVGDALRIEFPEFNKIVSNLPYSISSPVTFKLLQYKFECGVLMYQYEFARRMIALPNTKDYSKLSIAVQYYADAEILETVPGKAFSPPTTVKSAIVRLKPRPPPYEVKNKEFFMKLISMVFSQRRKKLKNVLKNISKDELTKLPSELLEMRGENLAPQQLAKLADLLYINV